MAENTEISWSDHTWSPWYGCTQVSMGEKGACVGCYARQISETRMGRVVFGGPGRGEGTRDARADSAWSEPLRWDRTTPGAFVFPSMCDPFDNHPDLPPLFRRFMRLIYDTPHLTWLLLTKRPGNIVKLFHDFTTNEIDGVVCRPPLADLIALWPRNAAIGCTVVTQEEADRDIPKLLAAKAALNPAFAFVSMEPLLGPVDISPWLGNNPIHGHVEEQRGHHLSDGGERQAGDPAGRHDLASLSEPHGSGGATVREGRAVSAGRNGGPWQAHLRAGAPAGLEALQGADTRGPDHQSFGREEEAQLPGEPGVSHARGAAGSCEPSAGNRGWSEPERRGQSPSHFNASPGDGDSAPTVSEGEAACDRGGLRDRLSDGLQDRQRHSSFAGIGWCISGGETDQGSHKARPSHPDWFRQIRDACAAAGVAYHHKQNGEWLGRRPAYALYGAGPAPSPADRLPHDIETGTVRVGKKRSGRFLDGVTYDARPEVRR